MEPVIFAERFVASLILSSRNEPLPCNLRSLAVMPTPADSVAPLLAAKTTVAPVRPTLAPIEIAPPAFNETLVVPAAVPTGALILIDPPVDVSEMVGAFVAPPIVIAPLEVTATADGLTIGPFDKKLVKAVEPPTAALNVVVPPVVSVRLLAPSTAFAKL